VAHGFGVVRDVHEEGLAEVFELGAEVLVVAIDLVSTDPPVAADAGACGVDYLQREFGFGASAQDSGKKNRKSMMEAWRPRPMQA
jgi:hypothetical protein